MLRMFQTHKIRKSTELSGKLWKFTPLCGEHANAEQDVFVPSCLETYPGLENYRGDVKYSTKFTAEGNIRLEFKGVSHYAEVMLDGKKIASHYGSYTIFDAISKNVPEGEHQLDVLVNNEFKKDFSLDIPNDYMSYGGISRGVLLEEVPDVFIRFIHITPIKNNNGIWNTKVEVCCENLKDEQQNLSLKINVASISFDFNLGSVAHGKSTVLQKTLNIKDVEDWSIDHPKLYEVNATLYEDGKAIDDLIDRVGFRTIKVDGEHILLNDKPIYIKGFCRHEDHPNFGCALPPEAMMYDLKLMRDMGANSVRTSHYPNDEMFLDMCDELGMLVWEENHARGITDEYFRNPRFQAQCETVINEMITAHYNHPSIYIWGILNECESDSEFGRKIYAALYKRIRMNDESRPYASASCKYGKDLCQDLESVCAWNMYPYWYDDDTATQKATKLHEWLQTHGGKGKPLLVTEVGAGAIYGFRNSAHDVWSEELQAQILKKQLTELSNYKHCTGIYIWQFCDVKVSKEWAMRRPKSQNNKGIVDEYRRPKLAYNEVKKIFGSINSFIET